MERIEMGGREGDRRRERVIIGIKMMVIGRE